MTHRLVKVVFTAALAAAGQAQAQAWVPEPGHGSLQLGYSDKMAHTSFDSTGNRFTNTTVVNGVVRPSYHDFRYGHFSGEIGVLPRLSVRALVTYLYGLEGPLQGALRLGGLSVLKGTHPSRSATPREFRA